MNTVLIVEDNADIAGLYERVFCNHRTHVLKNVPDAIGYLKCTCPDLMILDFHLEADSGLKVLNYLRSSSALRDVPVLAISADDLLKDTAKQHGANAFLRKPFRVTDLVNTAQHLILNSQSRLSSQLLAVLNEYADAHKAVFNRPPTGQWVDGEVIIDGRARDLVWLQAETRRLRSLALSGPPRNYLVRLIDKLRRM